MDSTNAHLVESIAAEPVAPVTDMRPAAVLKGTARGLEAIVNGGASPDAIVASIVERIEEAPAFFRGSDIRVRVEDGPLAPGSLARLDELATRFTLRIVEITAAKKLKDGDRDAVPQQATFAAGSSPAPVTAFDDEGPTHAGARPLAPATTVAAATAPSQLAATEVDQLAETAVAQLDDVIDGMSFEEPTQTAVPIRLAATPEIELETAAEGTRLIVGPVRSGVILEHAGTIIVFGDVNPGAEVRAQGNIIVLGRLRGTAHAGIGQEVGFILALQLQPQQLRIGRAVARSADSDAPGSETEIAYGTGDGIVVERYLGRLPRNLATSI